MSFYFLFFSLYNTNTDAVFEQSYQTWRYRSIGKGREMKMLKMICLHDDVVVVVVFVVSCSMAFPFTNQRLQVFDQIVYSLPHVKTSLNLRESLSALISVRRFYSLFDCRFMTQVIHVFHVLDHCQWFDVAKKSEEKKAIKTEHLIEIVWYIFHNVGEN